MFLFAVSVDSITEGDRRALMADLPASSTYSGALSYHHPQTRLLRRSLPNMAHSILVHEPAKIYPYHLLLITNYRLPADVDRCNLEVVYSTFDRRFLLLQFNTKELNIWFYYWRIHRIGFSSSASFIWCRVRGYTAVY